MPDEQSGKPVTISREELYTQVWATPMSRLAPKFGISGNGLAKICRRLDVPYPPRGYWARKAAGKKVSQPALPAPRQNSPPQVTFTPGVPAPSRAQLPPELEELLDVARRLSAGLTVPDKLLRPHSIVAAWIEKRRRLREQARRDPWYSGRPLPADFSAIERRRHRILSALFSALEKHGYTAKADERGRTSAEIDREAVYFTLKEKYRQVRRPLTDDEKKYGFNPKRPWKHETQATGLLTLSIETQLHPALRHSWVDTPDRTLEHYLPEIVSIFIVAAPLLQERRRRHEDAERQRREAEMRRYEERQRKALDSNRLRGFVELASRWKEAEVARSFLDALAARSAGMTEHKIGDRTIDEWLAWARERLAAHDPLEAGIDVVFRTIEHIDQWTYREPSLVD